MDSLQITSGLNPAFGHRARFLVRAAFAVLASAYFGLAGTVAPLWLPLAAVQALIAAYALAVLTLWLTAAHRRKGPPGLPTLLLDCAILTVIVMHDPNPACPSLVAVIMLVLDHSFGRRDLTYAVTAAIGIALTAPILRGQSMSADPGMQSAWVALLVLAVCAYAYWLLTIHLHTRREMRESQELADAADDMLFVFDPVTQLIVRTNRLARQVVGADHRMPLDRLFNINSHDGRVLAQEVAERGQANRQWRQRDNGADIEIKARALHTGHPKSLIACACRDISQHRQRAEYLFAESHTDPLTQLPNRRAFDETLDSEWRRMQRDCRQLGIIMLDIDRFKLYNDNFGHPAGDRCLRSIADALNLSLRRAGDFVARYGGEEFVIILPNADTAGLCTVGERILAAVNALGIEQAGDPPDQITLSAGAALATPHKAISPAMLLQSADHALYDAKRQGGDRLVLAETRHWANPA